MKFSVRFLLSVLGVGGAFFAAPAASFAAEPRTLRVPVERPVILPELHVTDTPIAAPPEDWRYTRIEGFEILSNASDTLTQDLLAEFVRFRQATRVLWPIPTRPRAAATIIFCARTGDFAQFDATPGTSGTRPLSLLLRNPEQLAIVVDLYTKEVFTDPQLLGLTPAEASGVQVDQYRLLFRQYLGLLLRESQSAPPAWLEEGLTQLVLDMEIVDRVLRYGRLAGDKIDGPDADEADILVDADTGSPIIATNNSLVVADEPFYTALRHRELMPFPRFFSLPREAPEAQSPLGNTLWAKQAYAFVHFCLFGEDQRHQVAFGKFVQRAQHEPVTEEMFRECFGLGYDAMVRQLEQYLSHPRHRFQKYTFKPDELPSQQRAPLRDATVDEIGLIKGDALRLAGRTTGAVQEYRAAYLNGARTPDLLAAWGGIEALAGSKERARKLLAAGVAAALTRPSGYLALARLTLADLLAAPGNLHGRLDAGPVADLLALLFRARALPPPLPETYDLAAEVWTRSAVPPQPEHLALLDEGLRYFPARIPLFYQTAVLYERQGLTERARALAQQGQQLPGTTADQARFEDLLRRLPAAP